MLNSRQRAQLRGLANTIQPIFQVGKTGLSEQFYKQIDEAISVRELIKVTVLETAPENSRVCADTVAENTGCDVVQVIGRKFILYRPATEKENRKIVLVK